MKRERAASPASIQPSSGPPPECQAPLSARRLRVARRYPEPAARLRYTLPQPFPMLRLSGRWLAEAGFQVGDLVHVAVTRGRLVITRTQPLTRAAPSSSSP